jgi:hypothetical protein
MCAIPKYNRNGIVGNFTVLTVTIHNSGCRRVSSWIGNGKRGYRQLWLPRSSNWPTTGFCFDELLIEEMKSTATTKTVVRYRGWHASSWAWEFLLKEKRLDHRRLMIQPLN